MIDQLLIDWLVAHIVDLSLQGTDPCDPKSHSKSQGLSGRASPTLRLPLWVPLLDYPG